MFFPGVVTARGRSRRCDHRDAVLCGLLGNRLGGLCGNVSHQSYDFIVLKEPVIGVYRLGGIAFSSYTT